MSGVTVVGHPCVAVLSRGRGGRPTPFRQLAPASPSTPPNSSPAGPRCSGCRRSGRISAGGATRLMRSTRRLVRAHAVATRRRRRRSRADRVRRGRRRSVAGRQPGSPTNASADVTARARLLGLPAAALGETAAAPPRITTLGAARRTARPDRASGRRPVLDVGRPAVRAAAGAGRRHRRQGREPRPARRHPRRAVGVLRLDERRKALVRSRFRRAGRPATAARGRRRRASSRRGPRRWPAGASARPTSRARDGRVWLRITGHGADGERADWVAFGDDAAVSGGLVGGTDSEPVFCGDAIADPLTGLHAALCGRRIADPRRRRADRAVDGRGRRNLRRGATALAETRCVATPPPSLPAVGARCGQRCSRTAGGRKAVGLMLIQRAVLLDGTATDIRVDERIVERRRSLTPHTGEQVLDAAGGTVIPGLHDHHVHLRSAAAALTSVRVGPAEVRGRDDLARALAGASRRQRRLDQGRRLPRGGRRTAGPRRARRGVAAATGPRAAPQRRAVDAELGGAGQGGADRSPRRPAAQRRPQLVGHVAAQRKRTSGGQPPAERIRRHRRHRRHTRPRKSATS